MPYGKTPAKMGHKDSAMEMSPYKMESAKQERKDLLQDNPVARDASGGRSWMSKHSKSGMGSAMKMGHPSPMEKHSKAQEKGLKTQDLWIQLYISMLI
jgi:hypothetical protein